MTKDELFQSAVEEELTCDLANIQSHALWMARLLPQIRDDASFKKLSPALREEIETICAAVE
jgi:hypothetical protein